MLVDGFLIILTARGQVVVAEATPEGYRERARVRAMDSGNLTRPSFAAGRIYVRNEHEIVAIGVTGASGTAPASMQAQGRRKSGGISSGPAEVREELPPLLSGSGNRTAFPT